MIVEDDAEDEDALEDAMDEGGDADEDTGKEADEADDRLLAMRVMMMVVGSQEQLEPVPVIQVGQRQGLGLKTMHSTR